MKNNRLINNLLSNIGLKISYIYVGLPMFLFFTFWCKWYVAIIGDSLMIYAYYNLLRDAQGYWKPQKDLNCIKVFVSALLIILFWVFLSGIGGFTYQNTDQPYRNTIFEILVNYDWPVTKQITMDNRFEIRGLDYYIGFWLPCAALGKILGLRAGVILLYLWTVLGIFCFFYLTCLLRKKCSLWPLLLFIFFSGLDIVGLLVKNGNFAGITLQSHIEWWVGRYQFSSFTTQLFWVFNQAIPAWIIVMLLLIQKNNRQMIFLLSLAMLSSTFPFVGMIPFTIYFLLKNTTGIKDVKQWIKKFAKDTFTVENVLAAGVIAFTCLFYLTANSSVEYNNMISSQNETQISENVEGAETQFETSASDYVGNEMNEILYKQEKMGAFLLIKILFLFFEVGIYILIIYKFNEDKIVLILALITSVLCLEITVGYGIDFCMRASIPLLVIMYVCSIFAIDNMVVQKKKFYLLCFLLIFTIGAFTPLFEMNRSIQKTITWSEDKNEIGDVCVSVDEIMTAGNFSSKIKGLYWNYLAKNHDIR